MMMFGTGKDSVLLLAWNIYIGLILGALFLLAGEGTKAFPVARGWEEREAAAVAAAFGVAVPIMCWWFGKRLMENG